MNNIDINTGYLKSVVAYLSEIQPPRLFKNIESLNNIADFITGKFDKNNLETRLQTYVVDNRKYHNVIANYGNEKDAILIIGAHYDAADTGVLGDSPGADDNASSVAGLLELSRLLAKNQPNLNFCVELVAYTLEEPPYFGTKNMGSYVHARSLDEKTNVLGMICLDMIGYFDKSKRDFISVIGNIKSRKLVKSLKKHMKKGSDMPVRSIVDSGIIPGYIDISDHRNYWKMGYRAAMVTDASFYRINNSYHTNKDTIDTLNFEKMAEVVKGLYNFVAKFTG